jgi:cytochrome P450
MQGRRGLALGVAGIALAVVAGWAIGGARQRRARKGGLVRASFADSVGLLVEVATPALAKGVIVRRPRVVDLAARLDLDGRAVRRLQRLRRRRGGGPVVLALPGRQEAILLEGEDVRRVLENSPEPFSPAAAEKRAAPAHFEPGVSLISTGAERAERRALQDAALESDRPIHSLANRLGPAVQAEARRLADAAVGAGELDWPVFAAAWMRLVRRMTLGKAAAEDEALTRMAARLRANANWTFAHPKDKALRAGFLERIEGHLARGAPGSLAERIAVQRSNIESAPADQIAQWLFAFDAVGITGFRTLALLATHPEPAARVRQEIDRGGWDLPYLRACVVDAVRLWPTTPAILRQTTRPTEWGGGTLPEGAGVLVFTPFFCRDDERLAQAHRFAPELWLGRDPADNGALTPFSAGPAACPARHLAPFTASLFLAGLLRGCGELRTDAPLDPAQPLPGLLDHVRLRFTLPERG